MPRSKYTRRLDDGLHIATLHQESRGARRELVAASCSCGWRCAAGALDETNALVRLHLGIVEPRGITPAARRRDAMHELEGRLVMVRQAAPDARDDEGVRVHAIVVEDPDPLRPDNTAYQDHGTRFVARWEELGDQANTAGVFVAGRLKRAGHAFYLVPPTRDEFAACERAYLAWSHDATFDEAGVAHAPPEPVGQWVNG